jgi:hypothetical protein
MLRALGTRQNPTPPAPRVPLVAKVFAAFSFLLALIGLLSFWPPATVDVVVWLTVWMGLCVATGAAILRQHRFAPTLVWIIIVVAGLSAGLALASGILDTFGVIIDIVLFVPMIWFAIWYRRRRQLAG